MSTPTLASLAQQRAEVTKKIYAVVAQLTAYERGDLLLSEDTKRLLELELLTLERQNVNLAADECRVAQQPSQQRTFQTSLFEVPTLTLKVK